MGEPTESPLASVTSSPTPSPSGSEAGCDDQSCEQKVCDEREKCCNKKWNDKCKNKAEKLCTPFPCTEDADGIFLHKMKNSEPVTKTCGWLQDQSTDKKKQYLQEISQLRRYSCSSFCVSNYMRARRM